MTTEGDEHGDRAAFLGGLRRRLADGVPPNPVHPLPPPVDEVPRIVPSTLESGDLASVFTAMAERAGAVVHRLACLDRLDGLLRSVVADRDMKTAVVSADPDARAAGEMLTGSGVSVMDLAMGAADADLGVTGAVVGIAATGSVVQASAQSGGRVVSLLPRNHLCILRQAQLVATTRDAFERIAADDRSSNVVVITGPSRSGDIEQLLITGVHGPTRVDIVLVAG
ncbi:MAG: LutC/YkgG family protein [Acidimicrobiales bacterium]